MDDKGSSANQPPPARNGGRRPRAPLDDGAKAGPASAARAWRTHPPLSQPPSRDPIALRSTRLAADVERLSHAQLEEIYRYLFLTRRLEEHLVALKRQGQVVGGVYRSLGQEATAVGAAYAMREGDYVQPLIRDLGAALVHGVEPLAVLRQYMARGTGPSAGRDLNVHISCPDRGLIGPVSMLGTCIPVVAGALLAARLRREPRAGLAFIGDGGSSTGAFYEGLNFAAVQNLPLVVVIEANGYAFSTPTARQAKAGDLLTRARGFGVAVAECDGNDVLACYGATAEARQRGLGGHGPTIVLAHTFRRLGHTDHDAGHYTQAGVAEAWAEHNDPISRFEQHVKAGRHLRDEDMQAVRQSVEESLQSARAAVALEPAPAATSVSDGVFAEDKAAVFPPPSSWLGGGAQRRGDTPVTGGH